MFAYWLLFIFQDIDSFLRYAHLDHVQHDSLRMNFGDYLKW
jgi:hypothetical protein